MPFRLLSYKLLLVHILNYIEKINSELKVEVFLWSFSPHILYKSNHLVGPISYVIIFFFYSFKYGPRTCNMSGKIREYGFEEYDSVSFVSFS